MAMATEIAFSSSSTSTTTPNSTTPTLYFDEKWKLSKKDGSRRSGSSQSSSFLSGNSSNKRCAFSRKCATLVKEQRARFYIMRRCVVMLICWREYADS